MSPLILLFLWTDSTKLFRYLRLVNKDRSEEERPFWYKHKNDDALFMVTTSEKRRKQDVIRTGSWAAEEMMRGGCRGGGGEYRWHSPMVQTCWGSVLRTERYIYIFCVLPHLESTPLGRVEHQEAFEEVLAVGGHVERDAVLSSEHSLTQLLQTRSRKWARHWNMHERSFSLIDTGNEHMDLSLMVEDVRGHWCGL